MKNLFYLLLLVCINPHLIAQTYDTLALKVGEVYNFEVGDEFHYYPKAIKVILSKTNSANNDTVFYSYKYTVFNENICGTNNAITDTIQEFVTHLNDYIVTQNDTTYTDMVGTITHEADFNADSLQYNGRRTNSISDAVGFFDTGYRNDTLYIEGCGAVVGYWGYDGLQELCGFNVLVYFKKGNEKWGYPLTMPLPNTPITPETSMTIGEVFDFDIGDQFQFAKNIHNFDEYNYKQYYVKRVVVGKQSDVPNNRVSYTYLDSVRYVSNNGLYLDYVETQTQMVEHLDSLAFRIREVEDSLDLNSYSYSKCLSANVDTCGNLYNSIGNILYPPPYRNFAKIDFIKGCGMYYTNKSFFGCYLPYGQTEQLLFYHKANGSCGESLPFYTFVAPFVSSNSINYLSVSPNPANNQVQIALPATANHQNATLQITDLQGRVVKTVQITPSFGGNSSTPSFGGGKGEASTHDLPNGMYLISYTQQGLLVGRAKMIVQH
jgi:hypothetical protein